jgi:hypothetical protein
MTSSPPESELSTLAAFVLDTVDRLRAITGEEAADVPLRDLHIQEITFSIPYDVGSHSLLLDRLNPAAGSLSLALAVQPELRLPQAESYLKSLDPRIVFDRARLIQLPEQELARLEITIRL